MPVDAGLDAEDTSRSMVRFGCMVYRAIQLGDELNVEQDGQEAGNTSCVVVVAHADQTALDAH